MKKIILMIMISVVLVSCNTEPNPLAWLDDMVRDIQRDPSNSCIDQIWEYEYDGGTVYYFSSGACCDGFNYLYDSEGNQIGMSGGFAGIMTGEMESFLQNRTNGTIYWERLIIWE
jgi:hypothetical protein